MNYYSLINLRDMQKFYAEDFATISKVLLLLQAVLANEDRAAFSDAAAGAPQWLENMLNPFAGEHWASFHRKAGKPCRRNIFERE